MKYPFSLAFIAFLTFSCTRTNNSPQGPSPSPADSLLKSYTIYSPGEHIRQVQLFSYDSHLQLASLHSYTYDTSIGDAYLDSISVVLSLTGTATPPPSYDILYQYHWAPPGGLLEHHVLFYDSQNRAVRDSIAAGNNQTNNTCVHFYYDAVSTVGQNLGYGPIDPNQVILGEKDSFQIASENIFDDVRYAPPGYGMIHEYAYLYSSYVSPLYNQTLAGSLGCTLLFHGFSDFRSKNLPSESAKVDGVSSGIGLQYSWTTDSIGRVIHGVAVTGIDLNPVQIHDFTY